MKDDLNGRRPQWMTTSMEDDLNGRRPQWIGAQWRTTPMEDNLKGITSLLKNNLDALQEAGDIGLPS